MNMKLYWLFAFATACGSSPADSVAPVPGNEAGVPPGTDGSTPSNGPLTVTPDATTLIPGAQQTFSCSIPCSWSIQGGASGGTITSAGLYTAPAATGSYSAIATAMSDPTKTATVRVLVTNPTPGVWVNVTPAGISLSPTFVPATNFGVQDVVADPARKSDLYAFVCYQGVWRSQDYGLTWTKVSTGTNAAVLETGRPWTAAIDNNASRDPKTPPTLYTTNGYGDDQGVFKSTDGGVNWAKYETVQGAYSLDMDPYDNQHLITGLHEGPGLAESMDGAVTWKNISTGTIGKSIYPHFIDTGNAATTAKTWLLVPQDNGPSMMTKDGGVNFTVAGDLPIRMEATNSSELDREPRMLAQVVASGRRWTRVRPGQRWR